MLRGFLLRLVHYFVVPGGELRFWDRVALHCVTIPCIVMSTATFALKYQGATPITPQDIKIAVQETKLESLNMRLDHEEKLVDAIIVGVFGNLVATIIQIRTNTKRRR